MGHDLRDVSAKPVSQDDSRRHQCADRPTGHTYTTQAHGGMLFPALAQSTGELPVPLLEEPSPYRDVMMPKRKQTREQNRRDRITAERRQRTELITEEERQRQAWLATNYQPPPF